jgi:hypothetical protein
LNAFGFKLQQRSITETDFNPELLNNPSATPDFPQSLKYIKPLLNADLIYQRKAAAKQIEMYDLLFERTKEYLSLNRKRATCSYRWLMKKIKF